MTEEQAAVRPAFDSYAIVELMGRVSMTGRVTEVEQFGSKLGKIDVIDTQGETVATEYFGGDAVYRITICTEDTARSMAGCSKDATPDVPWNMKAKLLAKLKAEEELRQKQLEAHASDIDEDAYYDERCP